MRELIDFDGRVAVVTGGASGIGEAVVTEFAKEGADVVVADIDDDRGPTVAEAIEADHGVSAAYRHTDVGDLGSCRDAVAATLDDRGRLDVLVNGAAAHAETAPFVEEEPEAWAPHIEVTLKGALNMTRAVLPSMIDEGSGSVVSITSESYKGQDPRLTVYATAKAGVVAFTGTLAKEVGEHGVRVNAISPSTTRTPASAAWLEQYGD